MTPFKSLPYETCWQYLNCPQDMRKDCMVYQTDMKEPCWILNQTGDGCDILRACKTCPWYLKSNTEFETNPDLTTIKREETNEKKRDKKQRNMPKM